MAKTQSVEPQIADLANGWLKSYELDYKLEQEPTGNSEIDNALNEYYSKNGGQGGNRPDAKLLLADKWGGVYPILIEYKGYQDKLIKLDDKNQVANKTDKNEPDFKNINSYALNGAVHYANAILHYTNYENIISIGMSGYKDDFGALKHEIAVYLVSKSNFGIGQEVGKFSDFSFLKKENFNNFIDKVKDLSLSDEEKAQIKEKLDLEIATSLTKLNNDIYKNESGLGENDRVYLVTASIIATLGIPGGVKPIKPLEKAELKSLDEDGNRDGDILMRKVKAFLNQKTIPEDKKTLIIRTLENTILSENLNRVINGETQLKRVFSKIVDDLGIYYKTDLSTDFTGKLFNEMYSWLGFSQDKLNDVVLTPSYVATLLARLARVDKDSFVWDFATGSAGLLVAAMNEMIKDAKNEIKSPDQLKHKIAHIKAKQLLGLEILPSVYMLAILNMILMGDGSSNILNKDSLTDFSGNYGFGENNGVEFPATAFILNPPYSAAGCGMIFVQKALKMMKKGYAAIIIQGSAGSGKASEYNKKILEQNTLIASIKMPIDLFIGKSSVQTYIYVFRIGEKHNKDEMVKFIDFSNDGYTRANRKKAKASLNLRDTGDAKARYDELVNLVRVGKSKLNIFTDKEYHEETIDPNSGSDWNKCAPVDTKPTLNDFKKCVSDYLAWEVSQILKKDSPSSVNSMLINKHNSIKWQEFEIKKLFESFNGNFDIKKEHINGLGEYVITAGLGENGILGKTDIKAKIFDENTITIDMFGNAFYRNFKYKMVTHARVFCLKPLFEITPKQGLFIANSFHFLKYKFGYENMCSWAKIKNEKILLPTKNGEIDFDFMENFISELEKEYVCELEAERVRELEAYLKATGLKDYELTQNEKDALAKFDEFSKWGGGRA
ncbi:N-6 DNA methylase [Campylobacter sp. CX2-4080-23]|nr:N-6 DNA methylase [Campylobacter sp. CX2-4080-23]